MSSLKKSVMNFTSGVVQTIVGTDAQDVDDAEEAGYDPHKHRIVPNPTTYADTMIHLLKGSIGAGILAMPEAVKHVGVIFATIGLIALGAFATFCILLLVDMQYRLCKRHRRGYMALPKSLRLSIREGPPSLRWSANFFAHFINFTLVFWQLGICTIYCVFVAENVKQLCDYYNTLANISVRGHLLIILIPVILINLVKDLKMMTPVSTLSNIITMIGLLLVLFYLIEDDIVLTNDLISMQHWLGIPTFIGTALFALEAVGVVLALEYNMENPKEFRGFFGLYTIGMTIIVVLYLAVGILGYVKYGSKVQASITLNLPPDQKKAQAAKILFAFAIFLSMPLQNFVAYSIIWRKINKKFKITKTKLCDYILRVICGVLPWCFAVAVPQLGPCIALMGAFCLSLLAMVFPGLMEVCVMYAEPTGYGTMKYILWRDTGIIIIGLLCLVFGVYNSIVDIIHSYT